MFAFLSHLSLRTRFLVLFGAFFIPIGLLLWLFIVQCQKDISFSSKEIDGVVYMQKAWPAYHALILRAGDARVQLPAEMLTQLNQARAQYSQDMNAVEVHQAAEKSYASINDKSESEHVVAAVSALKALITKISDGSNLTLDPDLDSYYEMDTIAFKMPDFIDKMGIVQRLAHNLSARTEALSTTEKASFLIAAGQLSGAADAVKGDYESALAGNADGTVKANLGVAMEEFAAAMDVYIAQTNKLGDDIANGNSIDTKALDAAYQTVQQQAYTYWQLTSADLVRLLTNRVQGFQDKLYTNLALVILVCMVMGVSVFWEIRKTLAGLHKLESAFHALAQLDLTVRSQHQTSDEIGLALKKYNQSIDQIASMLKNTQQASMSVSAATNELSSTMDNIADFTSQQDASIDSIFHAVEQAGSKARDVTKKAVQSSMQSEQAKEKLEKTQYTVTQLRHNAQEIGKARAVIQGISEQINLLALNAAIEAARAGDAGRGFAVVSDEVRKLANNTNASTAEIAEMISQLQNRVDVAWKELDDVVHILEEVKTNASSMVTLVTEQTNAVEQINQSLADFRTGMQQVNTNLKESNIASASIANSAEDLNRQVSNFRVS